MQLAPTSPKEDPIIRQLNSPAWSDQQGDEDFNSLLLLACRISTMPAAILTKNVTGGPTFIAKAGNTPASTDICYTLQLNGDDAAPLGHLHLINKTQTRLTDDQKTGLGLVSESLVALLRAKSGSETENLDRQKAFYENILNKLPTDIAVFDGEHRYLFVNPGAISNEEYRKYIIGKDDYEYVAYRNRDISVAHARREKFLEAKNTRKEVRWEDSLRDPQGNMITHLRRMFPVFDDHGELTLVIGYGLDITDRKIMEEKQAALVKQLSSRNTKLTDFCSIVSHNLRAPLVNMSMLADFIEASEDAGEQKLLISKLRPVIDHLNNTFNQLVESIQISQDLEIERKDVCLEDCIKRTIEGLQPEINKLDARIVSDLSAVSVINYPPQYLDSIIHNLISNSLKYHHPGRKPLISIRTKKEDSKIILSVSDNGLGIDLNKHRDNFFKIGKVFHRHPNAKGFGLYMTKTQVEAMGGKIWVESMPGQGTEFYIEFDNRIKSAS
jgi:PAS domain S-box-containing protein